MASRTLMGSSWKYRPHQHHRILSWRHAPKSISPCTRFQSFRCQSARLQSNCHGQSSNPKELDHPVVMMVLVPSWKHHRAVSVSFGSSTGTDGLGIDETLVACGLVGLEVTVFLGVMRLDGSCFLLLPSYLRYLLRRDLAE